MNKRFLWVLGLVMIFAASPVYAGKAMQMWNCGLSDDVSEEAVEAHVSEWLKAARQVDGGENIEAFILFPVAVNAMGCEVTFWPNSSRLSGCQFAPWANVLG